ncbi:MAG: Crp/Fnr family transcriptional regulator, partial [Chitinophagaceae bacterium]
ALEDSEIVQINREDFLTALFNDISIATKFVSLIGKEVKHKEDRLLNLAYDSLRKRVARGLLEMHAKFTNDSQKPSIDLCREDIAQYVGAATESLIRTLSDFKSEGLIEIKEGKILINEPAKLADLIA